MNEIIRFACLGWALVLYAFASQGLIVIFRGTGVLNFSLGATGIAGVFLQYELQYERQNFGCLILRCVALHHLGVLTHWVILRPLQRKRASNLIQLLATLGVLVTVQAGVVIRYGSKPRQVPSASGRPCHLVWRRQYHRRPPHLACNREFLCVLILVAVPIIIWYRNRGGFGERAFCSGRGSLAEQNRCP